MSPSTCTPPAGSQRRAHAHAARAAHARTRRLRVKEYQAANVKENRDGTGDENGSHAAAASSQRPPNSASLEGPLVSGPLDLLGANRRSPFDVFAMALKPIEHFLLDHYVRTVVTHMDRNCHLLRDPGSCMVREWVQLAIADAGFMRGVFLVSARHLSCHDHRRNMFAQLAIQYKLSVVRSLADMISAGVSSFGDAVVAKVLVLAVDEASMGDAEMARKHVEGAVKMVELNGGPQTLGLQGYLQLLLSKFEYEMGLRQGVALLPYGDGTTQS